MSLSILHRSFPVPKYLLMPSVGFDISDRSIKIAKMHRVSGVIRPEFFDNEEIPEGIIDKGSIVDPEKLQKIFKKLKTKHKIKSVTVSLPEEKAYVFNIKFSSNIKDIRSAIELQIEEHVPFSAPRVVFDYEIIESKPGEWVSVSVSALSRQVVEDYLEVLSKAEIMVSALEIEAHSLARAVISVDDISTCMIVDFGQTRSGFTIVSKGNVQFSTTVNIGGDNLVKAIAEKFEITEQLARKMKEERGLRKTTDEELFFVLTPVVSLLRDEINKYQMYWDSKKDVVGERTKIGKIILCGGDANMPGLIDHISSGSEVKFELGNPWINITTFDDYIPSIGKTEALRYATAIGLALRRFKKFTR